MGSALISMFALSHNNSTLKIALCMIALYVTINSLLASSRIYPAIVPNSTPPNPQLYTPIVSV